MALPMLPACVMSLIPGTIMTRQQETWMMQPAHTRDVWPLSRAAMKYTVCFITPTTKKMSKHGIGQWRVTEQSEHGWPGWQIYVVIRNSISLFLCVVVHFSF